MAVLARRSVWVVVMSACGRIGFDGVGGGTTDDASGDGSPPGNRVFVTSTATAADFGGQAAADALCTSAAAALGGTFVAFVNPVTGNPIDRLAGSRGWVRLDGRPVYDTVADMMAFRSYYPIALDEHAQPLGTCAWTGSTEAGSNSSASCGDWTNASSGTASFGRSTSTGWTGIRAGFITCNSQCSVYCFEIGHDVVVMPPAPSQGRMLFVATSGWAGGTLASADLVCSMEAAAAGVTGTFRALVATTTTTAASRLSSLAGPWVRGDGVLLTTGSLDQAFEISPDVRADGTPLLLSTLYAWMGATNLTSVGSTADTCSDWSSSAGFGRVGYAGDSASALQGGNQYTCGIPIDLYCAED